MGNCKTQAIQTDLDIFKHILAYSGVWVFRNIKAYSGIFRRILCNPETLGTLVYLESQHIQNQWHVQNLGIFKTWYIQNQRHIQLSGITRTLVYSELDVYSDPVFFRTLAYTEPEAYSESYLTASLKRFAKIVNGSNYFPNNHSRNIIFSHSLLYEINIINFVNTGLFFFQKYLFYVTKYRSRGWGDEFCVLFLIYPFKVLQ